MRTATAWLAAVLAAAILVPGSGEAAGKRKTAKKTPAAETEQQMLSRHVTIAEFGDPGARREGAPLSASFKILRYLAYEKIRPEGSARTDRITFPVPAQFRDAVLALKPGDRVFLSWNHVMGNRPDWLITKLERAPTGDIRDIPPEAGLSGMITLDFKSAPLADVLKDLKDKAGLQYLAPEEVLKNAAPVTLSGEKTVKEHLDDACARANVAWEKTAEGGTVIKSNWVKIPGGDASRIRLVKMGSEEIHTLWGGATLLVIKEDGSVTATQIRQLRFKDPPERTDYRIVLVEKEVRELESLLAKHNFLRMEISGPNMSPPADSLPTPITVEFADGSSRTISEHVTNAGPGFREICIYLNAIFDRAVKAGKKDGAQAAPPNGAAGIAMEKLDRNLRALLERLQAKKPYDDLKEQWVIEAGIGGDRVSVLVNLDPAAPPYDAIAAAAVRAGGKETHRFASIGGMCVRVPIANLEAFLAEITPMPSVKANGVGLDGKGSASGGAGAAIPPKKPAPPATAHASLAAYPNAVVSVAAAGIVVAVAPDGRTLKATNEKSEPPKPILWSVDLVKAWGAPATGSPVIRSLRIEGESVVVTIGKSMTGKVEIRTGKATLIGED